MDRAKKRNFIMYKDWYIPTKDLTLEEKGTLWDAVFQYQFGVDVKLDNPVTNMAFSIFREAFNSDWEKYLETSEKRREIGRKGGKSKGKKEK